MRTLSFSSILLTAILSITINQSLALAKDNSELDLSNCELFELEASLKTSELESAYIDQLAEDCVEDIVIQSRESFGAPVVQFIKDPYGIRSWLNGDRVHMGNGCYYYPNGSISPECCVGNACQ